MLALHFESPVLVTEKLFDILFVTSNAGIVSEIVLQFANPICHMLHSDYCEEVICVDQRKSTSFLSFQIAFISVA